MTSVARRLGAAAVLVMALGSAASAQEQSTMAGAFLDLCVSPSAEARGACGAFVVGMIDVHSLLAAKNPERRKVCPTRALTSDLARQLFVEWAERNRADLDLPFWEAVETSIRERYPCGAPIIRLPQR